MARPAHRDEVRQLVERGAQLVEVLDEAEYQRAHLVGALSIPLRELDERAPQELDPARPVVVYCYDALCDLSPRAAARLDTLGFREVYDYVASKVDWMANSLPWEGEDSAVQRIGALADREVPTCMLEEPAPAVRERLREHDDVCVVIDEQRVVLGVVHAAALMDSDGLVADVVRDGPATYRPDVSLTEMASRLERHPEARVLVTNGDGTLVGIAQPEEIQRAAKAAAPHRGS